MNEPFERDDRRMPYEVSEETFEALRMRIGRCLDASAEERPDGRPAAGAFGRAALWRQGLMRWGVAAAGVAAVAVGLVAALSRHRPAEPDVPDLDRLLSTASVETLRQAAVENYDDIFYNQQL